MFNDDNELSNRLNDCIEVLHQAQDNFHDLYPENTLLSVGDCIRIREDIQPDSPYDMILNSDCKNTWCE